MASIVSLISGQFTRSLIFGAFFPVALFLLLAAVSVAPLMPRHWQLVTIFHSANSEAGILIFSVNAVILTVFLYLLNTPLVRMFEGYPWQFTRIGTKRKQTFQAEHAALEMLLPRLRFLRRQWSDIDPNHPNAGAAQKQINGINRALNFDFPSKRELILPTRFGNVLRSFETYSLKQYGIDAILFWPRIITVADKETLAAVEDARSSVDFFVNCSVLSALLAALLFCVGCLEINRNTPWQTVLAWPLETVAAALSAVLFYSGAINKVSDWGAQVRSVFDLFRFDLLKKMGYGQTPEARNEERALWTDISKQVAFGDSPITPPLPYKKPGGKRTVVAMQPEVAVSLTAGVTRQPNRLWKYTYRIANQDGTQAASATLTETLPDGWTYIWGSALATSGACSVEGTNPYVFTLGAIPALGTVEVTFSVTCIETKLS